MCGCLQKSITTDNITTNNTEVIFSHSVETCFSSTDVDTSTDSTGLYLYLDISDDDNEQKIDKINRDVVFSYSAETCSTDTSTDSPGWDEIRL